MYYELFLRSCRIVHTRHCLHMALGSLSTGVEVALQPGEGAAAAPVTQLKLGEKYLYLY